MCKGAETSLPPPSPQPEMIFNVPNYALSRTRCLRVQFSQMALASAIGTRDAQRALSENDVVVIIIIIIVVIMPVWQRTFLRIDQRLGHTQAKCLCVFACGSQHTHTHTTPTHRRTDSPEMCQAAVRSFTRTSLTEVAARIYARSMLHAQKHLCAHTHTRTYTQA